MICSNQKFRFSKFRFLETYLKNIYQSWVFVKTKKSFLLAINQFMGVKPWLVMPIIVTWDKDDQTQVLGMDVRDASQVNTDSRVAYGWCGIRVLTCAAYYANPYVARFTQRTGTTPPPKSVSDSVAYRWCSLQCIWFLYSGRNFRDNWKFTAERMYFWLCKMWFENLKCHLR